MAKKQQAARKAAPVKHALPAQLRQVIESRGLTATELGRLSDVDPTVIGRFVASERDLRLETAGKIAAALGLRLVEVAGPRARGKPTRG